MTLDSVFELLDKMDAETLTMIPRDAGDRALGVVVAVRESAAQEFLEFLEQWDKREPATPDAPEPDDYGWQDV